MSGVAGARGDATITAGRPGLRGVVRWLVNLQPVRLVVPSHLQEAALGVDAELRVQYLLTVERAAATATPTIRWYRLDASAGEAIPTDESFTTGAPLLVVPLPERATDQEAVHVARMVLAAVLEGHLAEEPAGAGDVDAWTCAATVALALLRLRGLQAHGPGEAELRRFVELTPAYRTQERARAFLGTAVEMVGGGRINPPPAGEIASATRHSGVDVVRSLFGLDGPGWGENLQRAISADVESGVAGRLAARERARLELGEAGAEHGAPPAFVFAVIAGAVAAMEAHPEGCTLLGDRMLCHRCGAVTRDQDAVDHLECPTCAAARGFRLTAQPKPFIL